MAARFLGGLWTDANGNSARRPLPQSLDQMSHPGRRPEKEWALPRSYSGWDQDSPMVAAVKHALYGDREPYSHFGPLPSGTSSHCSEDDTSHLLELQRRAFGYPGRCSACLFPRHPGTRLSPGGSPPVCARCLAPFRQV
eukprot:gnl/MRDRNA2_/MRDRNA2_57255_c0_seq1.p1 gnl/MRDRNA2_/MRDRNA2_57255_c0~~gnl/MRDRNA2_/MRDRNA2_57255_c0_seq1.p1  ORF type:complete len:139 (-),score=12.73 gnl/MRDRNA2_/MRDRNA2_57255_c0_seq1:36-452(-)